MSYEFDTKTPIYLQLQHLFRLQIITGQLPAGSQMPTVRDIAIEYGVNPNTVQRALSELERDKLARSERTSGRFITKDEERIKNMRNELAKKIMVAFISDMKKMNLSLEESIEQLQTYWRDSDDDN